MPLPFASLALLIASLLLLTGGAEVLVRGSVALAQRMGVSSFFIGLTIVGFGTSSPELAAGVTAAVRGYSDINIGNVVGSNICNIALILGLTALIAPIAVQRKVVRDELWIVILVSTVPLAALLTGGVITRWFAGVMLVALLAYVWRGYRIGRADAAGAEGMGEIVASLPEPAPRAWRQRTIVHIGAITGGLLALVVGSHLLVESAVAIARGWGVSELAIGLTIVALGTSAPELVTSIVAAFRRQSDLSVGNILGSNIFNILGILAVSSLITPQAISRQTFLLDLPVMIALAAACLPIMLSGGRISRGEGALLLAAYVAYVIVLLVFISR